MPAHYSIDLQARYGADAIARLAAAYEVVILSISLGCRDRIPSRAIRLAVVDAMLAEGERGGFDRLRLVMIGTSVARSDELTEETLTAMDA